MIKKASALSAANMVTCSRHSANAKGKQQQHHVDLCKSLVGRWLVDRGGVFLLLPFFLSAPSESAVFQGSLHENKKNSCANFFLCGPGSCASRIPKRVGRGRERMGRQHPHTHPCTHQSRNAWAKLSGVLTNLRRCSRAVIDMSARSSPSSPSTPEVVQDCSPDGVIDSVMQPTGRGKCTQVLLVS